jgi:NAD(P)-dependent dehydrogenase (short-subunit alcohol dehydrogenase family)
MAKAVLITGTSTGIGRACVERMAADGWTVYAGARKESDLASLTKAVAGDVRPVILDVTVQQHIDDIAGRLQADLGGRGLDGVVNNAGLTVGGPFEALTDEDWRAQFDVNVFGLINVTRTCFPLLRAARGRVVNVASISGRISGPLLGPYAASKHAVEAITEGLRFEVEQFGMKVSCVEPGQIKTAIWEKADDQLTQLTTRFDPEVIARYPKQTDMMYGFIDEGPRRGAPPSKVADVVHHALTANRPKDRYLVGPDAGSTGLVSKLPDPIRRRMLTMRMNMWIKSGSKLRAEAEGRNQISADS